MIYNLIIERKTGAADANSIIGISEKRDTRKTPDYIKYGSHMKGRNSYVRKQWLSTYL